MFTPTQKKVSHIYVIMKYGYSESNQREFETPNRTSPV